jgi:hypothetical protein
VWSSVPPGIDSSWMKKRQAKAHSEHRGSGSMAKSGHKLVQAYYKTNRIRIVGPLSKDLEARNSKALRYLAYAIMHLHHVKGVRKALKEIAKISREDKQGRREYQNRLVEFHALRFVSRSLGLNIQGLEERSMSATGNKTCDIMALEGDRRRYFEVKDASAEILFEYPDSKYPKITHFDPKFPPEVARWIKTKAADANAKGADSLICHTPRWSDSQLKIELLKLCGGSKRPLTLKLRDNGTLTELFIIGMPRNLRFRIV